MSPEEQQPLRVNVKGVTEKMLNILQYFFRDPCNNYCEIVNDASADLAIIDLDGIDGRRLVDEHRQTQPEQPLIVLSIHNEEFDDAILIQKPMKPELLVQALETINEELQNRRSSSQANTENQPDEPADLQEQQLLAEIEEIRNDATTSVDIIVETTGETLAVGTESPAESAVEADDRLPPASETLTAEKVAGDDSIKDETESSAQEVDIPAAVTKQKVEIAPIEPPPREAGKTNVKANKAIADASGDAADSVKLPAEMTNTRDERGYIGTAPDIDQNNPYQVARAQYDPDDYFQSYIQQAAIKATKYRRAVLLTMPHGSLVVKADTKTALLDIKESRLRAFCSLPITDETLTIVLLENSALLEYRQHSTPIALEQLLWKAALWASRGRVPVGTHLNNLVYFQEWPNISRSLLFPNALRIAAFWVEKPCSLINTAKTLKIPQRYVFAFYSASNAIGIAFVRSSKKSDQGKSRKIKKARDKNLLGRILNHIHGTKRKINGGKS